METMARARSLAVPAMLAGFLLALLAAGLLVPGCRRDPAPREEPAAGSGPGTAAQSAPAQPALYHCPMHPTMVSDRPGDCPICSMRMVPMEEQTAVAPQSAPSQAPAPGGRRVIYRSTMNPGEVSDNPGVDSMGMEMVPVEVEAGASTGVAVEGYAALNIPLRKQQLIGVRIEEVRRVPFMRAVRAVGRVTADETRLHHVHTKVGGWVEKLYVDATGEKVGKGQPLLTLYSPELLATQEEYLLALRSRRAQGEKVLPEVSRLDEGLLESARRRLLLFDFTPEQVERLESTGEATRSVTLFAPSEGYVLKRLVSHGEKIDPNATLLEIADLSRVWVLASVYEYELPFVKAGQRATMALSFSPGRTYRGRVVYVYPVLDPATRTVQVRLEFENPALDLKPEMYAQVALHGDLGERLAVPDTAVLGSGTREIVFVAEGDGYFEPRLVRSGLRSENLVEIVEGLTEGERVVVSGNFFVDSESKLKAALAAAAASAPRTGPQTRPAPEERATPGPSGVEHRH